METKIFQREEKLRQLKEIVYKVSEILTSKIISGVTKVLPSLQKTVLNLYYCT